MSKAKRVADAKEFVDAKIAGKRVVVFSKSYCPYCRRAKQLLKSKVAKEDYDFIEIEDMENCNEIQEYLLKLTRGKTVPRVFIDQKSIGGSDDVERMVKSGELAALLKG